MDEEKLGSTIDFEGYKGKKIRKIRNGTYLFKRNRSQKEKNLEYILSYLQAIKGPLDLTEQQTKRAWYLYNKIKSLN